MDLNRKLLFIASLALILAVAVLHGQSRPGPQEMPKPFASPSAMKFPKVIGWPAHAMPRVPKGFAVDELAAIESPRWLYELPNGDLLVSQAKGKPPAGSNPEMMKALFDAGALGPSPNQITLLRDADKDGTYETQKPFLTGLNQPFGIALQKGYLYVANTDSVVRYSYQEGMTSISTKAEKILDLPAGDRNLHWTRNILFSPSGDKLYIGVGSQTNVDEEGIDAKDPHRATILECNPDGTGLRIFASGLRNPVGMDWSPDGALWAVVNERDELGDDVPPDYLTSVRQGGFYGWPYAYFGIEDPRQKGKRPDLVAKSITPDVPLGAHTASLGFVFYRGSSFPARYRNGAFIGQHGSWNRSKFSGYRVVFVSLNDEHKSVEDFITGFIASDDRGEVYGRPVGVAALRDGSIVIADDAGNRIWRVRSMEDAR